jgi:hypothetical protein
VFVRDSVLAMIGKKNTVAENLKRSEGIQRIDLLV